MHAIMHALTTRPYQQSIVTLGNSMQTAPANFDDDIYGLMRAMAADMQTSIALNRAMFRTLAMLSLDYGVAAATALEDETEQAQRTQAPQQMLEALKCLQA